MRTRPRHTVRRRAVTLVEVLVTVGVIGLLLAILTPTLAGARAAALRTVSRSNARECWRVIDLYSHANAGAFPRCLPGIAYSFDSSLGGLTLSTLDSAAWMTAILWPAVVRDAVAISDFRGVILAPGAPDPYNASDNSHTDRVSYHFSNSFVAKGALWTEPMRTAPRERLLTLIADVRSAEVAHPSSKAGLWDWDLPYIRDKRPYVNGLPADPTPIAFADGHVDVRNPQDATAPAPNPLRAQPSARLHDTPAGVQGHDY